jgi:hypothetical protein
LLDPSPLAELGNQFVEKEREAYEKSELVRTTEEILAELGNQFVEKERSIWKEQTREKHGGDTGGTWKLIYGEREKHMERANS